MTEPLQQVYKVIEPMADRAFQGKKNRTRPLAPLMRLLEPVVSDSKLLEASRELKERGKVFDALRDALRVALPEGKNGLNDEGEPEEMKTIEARVKAFRERLVTDEALMSEQTYRKMVAQLDKYWEKLFADPLVVETSEGKTVIQPQRTNNVAERLFRDEKRGYRRRSGSCSLKKRLQSLPAAAPLVKNLGNEEYRELLLDGSGTLAERFARIDVGLVRQMLADDVQMERLSPAMRKLTAQEELPGMILTLFRQDSNICANRLLWS